jgi:tetratricopeptide (TPR) repeat protein
MNVRWLWIFFALLPPVISPAAPPATEGIPLAQRQWFETRTAHFNIYSCGEPEQVFKVANQLEQFCEAYAQLAGAQAVAAPPIVVMAFPDHEAMKPFLPLYHGQPENLAGLFQRGDDENLIVLSLPGNGAAAMDMTVVFHEYTHFLLRRNDRIWPLWLKEGMAEIYSTFETTGYNALIAQPIDHHLRLLAQQPLLPLAELFAVGHDSPEYNERERQGIFYAESWLLTHYLMAGDNDTIKARFRSFTPLLHEGQTSVQAFTNALRVSLPMMNAELQRYLEQGQFTAIQFALPADVAADKAMATRLLPPVENYFRLGDELLRIDRPDEAEKFFADAQKLAPASPLPCEGLGLLALRGGQSDEALRQFKEAIRRGSGSYLAHYFYAREKFRLAADAQNNRGPLPKDTAAEIHGELLKSIVLMPDFGPAHELFGILEMAQGENPSLAEQHLQLAVQLEPENPHYLLALADTQLRNQEADAARRTLTTLLLPTVDAKLRIQAEELLRKIAGPDSER